MDSSFIVGAYCFPVGFDSSTNIVARQPFPSGMNADLSSTRMTLHRCLCWQERKALHRDNWGLIFLIFGITFRVSSQTGATSRENHEKSHGLLKSCHRRCKFDSTKENCLSLCQQECGYKDNKTTLLSIFDVFGSTKESEHDCVTTGSMHTSRKWCANETNITGQMKWPCQREFRLIC